MKAISPRSLSAADSGIVSTTKPHFYRIGHARHGFTVIELIVIIAIMAILSTVSVLGIAEWRANTELKTTARDVVSSFQFARVEAAKRNATASVEVTKGGIGVGKCQVIIGGQTIREVTVPGSVEVTKLEQPVGTTVVAPDATYQLSNRGFPLGLTGKVTLSNGEKSYEIEFQPAGGVSLTGPY